MLADPRRGIKAARAGIFDGLCSSSPSAMGQMRRGKIIAMGDTQAKVLEQGTERTWKTPCLAMQGYTDAEGRNEDAPYGPPPERVIVATKARKFQRGGTVTSDDREGRGITVGDAWHMCANRQRRARKVDITQGFHHSEAP